MSGCRALLEYHSIIIKKRYTKEVTIITFLLQNMWLQINHLPNSFKQCLITKNKNLHVPAKERKTQLLITLSLNSNDILMTC